MAAVDVNHVAAGELGHIGGLGVGVSDHVHHGLVHLNHFVAVEVGLHGAGADDVAAGGQGGSLGPAARVGQFDGGQGAPLVDGVHRLDQGGQQNLVVQMGHGGVGVVGEAVHTRLAQRDDAGPAFGDLVVHLKGLSGVEGDVAAGGHGGRLHPVLDIDAAHTDGREQVGVAGHG